MTGATFTTDASSDKGTLLLSPFSLAGPRLRFSDGIRKCTTQAEKRADDNALRILSLRLPLAPFPSHEEGGIAVFEITKASIKIWNLQRKKRAGDAKYLRQIAEAKAAGKSKDEVKAIWEERLQFANDVDGAVAIIETWVLVQHAENLRLPLPDVIVNGPNWTKLTQEGSPVLVDAARADLRAEIRAERMARWDMRMRWIGPITGLLGTLAAVLSLLKK